MKKERGQYLGRYYLERREGVQEQAEEPQKISGI